MEAGEHYKGKFGFISCDAAFTTDEITELQTAMYAKLRDDTNDAEQMHEPLDYRLEKLIPYVQGTEALVLSNQNIKDMYTAVIARIHDLQRDSLEVSATLLSLKSDLLHHRNEMNPS